MMPQHLSANKKISKTPYKRRYRKRRILDRFTNSSQICHQFLART